MTKHVRYWGKTSRYDPTHRSWHPAMYHNLDVAACGKVFLEQNPFLWHKMSDLAGLPSDDFAHWITFLLAIHDIGKLADGFQSLCPDLMSRLQLVAICMRRGGLKPRSSAFPAIFIYSIAVRSL